MSDLEDLDDLVGDRDIGRRRPRAPNLGNHKTHCKRGHEFTPDNTIWEKAKAGRRARKCRACKNAQRRTAPPAGKSSAPTEKQPARGDGEATT